MRSGPPASTAVGGIFVRTLVDIRITAFSINMHCRRLTCKGISQASYRRPHDTPALVDEASSIMA